jgi:hypothetical protein
MKKIPGMGKKAKPVQEDRENWILEGHLDLRDFSNLKILIIERSKLDSVDLSGCPELEKLIIYSDQDLVDFNLSNNKKLKDLKCDPHKLSEPAEKVRCLKLI